MTATTFDTLMYAKKLKEAGLSENQAEIQAEALKSFEEKIEEHIHSNTNNGKIEKLETNIVDFKISMAKIEAVMPHLATKEEVIKSRNTIIYWLVGLFIAGNLWSIFIPYYNHALILSPKQITSQHISK